MGKKLTSRLGIGGWEAGKRQMKKSRMGSSEGADEE